jgi:hypothetical protein
MNPGLIAQIQQIGTGAAFILFPLIFIFTFSVHPGLMKPRLLGPTDLIYRARRKPLLQFGHSLVLLSTGLLIVIACNFTQILSQSGLAWLGWIGGLIASLGAILLAADKGALCLSMSALDTLPEAAFSVMMPGLLAMFSKKGWMVLLWGIVLLPLGFTMQAVGLLLTGTLPGWQSILFLLGVLLIAVPDGIEIVNLSASLMMGASLIPYGIHLIQSAL